MPSRPIQLSCARWVPTPVTSAPPRDHDAAERGQAVSDFARDLVMAPLTVQLAAVVNHALARREG
jgi:hypothetical protein